MKVKSVEDVAPLEYDVLVFIGRFRIFHNGHRHIINAALEKARHVVVLVGSANKPRDLGNEFTAQEAQQMIESVYPVGSEAFGRMTVQQVNDYMHDNDYIWLAGVHKAVRKAWQKIGQMQSKDYKPKIGLIGYSKDKTSYYLKKFPQWDAINVPAFKIAGNIVSATSLRSSFFYENTEKTEWQSTLQRFVPDRVIPYLSKWRDLHEEELAALRDYRDFIAKYREEHQFRGALDEDGRPMGKSYGSTHNTVDSIIVQSGHVLLIRRARNPGKGLWALPGGFLDPDEYTLEGSVRELREETGLDLPLETLQLAFRFKHQFNSPFRSKRGRISTAVHLYVLNDRNALPPVKGDDDADMAEWVALGDIDPKMMFEDHYHLIWKMLNMLPPQ